MNTKNMTLINGGGKLSKHPKSELLQDECDKLSGDQKTWLHRNGNLGRIQMLVITINNQLLSDTIKANYYKMSAANIIERSRMNYRAMGVLIEYGT